MERSKRGLDLLAWTSGAITLVALIATILVEADLPHRILLGVAIFMGMVCVVSIGGRVELSRRARKND